MQSAKTEVSRHAGPAGLRLHIVSGRVQLNRLHVGLAGGPDDGDRRSKQGRELIPACACLGTKEKCPVLSWSDVCRWQHVGRRRNTKEREDKACRRHNRFPK